MRLSMMMAIAAAGLASSVAFAQTETPADAAAAMFEVDAKSFVDTVASSDQFEIRSSELAKERAETDEIKMFADEMIADHTQAGAKMKAAAEQAGVALPAPDAIAPKHRLMLAQLEGVQGADFQTLYVDMQVQAHMEAVALFSTFAKSAAATPLVTFAQETLPTLKGHGTDIMEIAAK